MISGASTAFLLLSQCTILCTMMCFIEEAGGVVAGLAFLIELTELHGRDRLAGYDVFSMSKGGRAEAP